MDIAKLPIGKLVVFFIMYVVTHIAIGWYSEKLKKEVIDKPGNKEIEGQNKAFGILYKWYPAMYVIMLLVYFYNQ